MRLALLLLLAPLVSGAPELLAIGSFSQAATGGSFHGGWWYVAVYAFVMWVVIGSALKRSEPMQVILAFLRDTAAALLAGLATTHVARHLFAFPQLLDLNWTATVYYDNTDIDTARKLSENARAARCRQPAPHPHARRCILPQSYVYWAGPKLTVGALLLVQAAYLFLGKYDDVYEAPLAAAIPITVIGLFLLLAAVVDMLARPAPWSHLPSNRHTLKYLLLAVLVFVLPVFYDSILPGGPLVRGALTAAIYIAAWAVFYAVAVGLWPDNIFYRRPRHALWFAVVGAIPNVLGFIAGGVANHLYPGDSFNAMLSQLVAAALAILAFLAIRAAAYPGYSCNACKSA